MNESDRDESTLDRHACWALLATAEIGRLAVVIGGRPKIFPVTFVIDRGSVVFRTAAGTKLAAIRGTSVAFEADGIDPQGPFAWSVVLEGRAEEIRQLQELAFAAKLPLSPWHPSPKPHFVRVVPGEIFGRRFRIDDRAQKI
jgi:uncharacterized protein